MLERYESEQAGDRHAPADGEAGLFEVKKQGSKEVKTREVERFLWGRPL